MLIKTLRKLLLILLSLLYLSITAYANDSPESTNTDVIVNLPLTDTWALFTTDSGLSSLSYDHVHMRVHLGEQIRAERITGKITEVIDATLTSFDPPHMISWQWSNQACWSVLYFNAMGSDMTQIKWVDRCTDPASVDLNKQVLAHRNLFDLLVRRFAPECHVCKEEREANHK